MRGLGIMCVVLLAACDAPRSLGPIEATLASDGTFRVFARRVYFADFRITDDYRFATGAGGAWARELVWDVPNGAEPHFSPPPYWLLQLGDRDVVVAEAPDGNRVLVRGPEGVWSPVEVGAAVAEDARIALASGHVGGAWVGVDGELRVLVDGWLLESSGGSLVRALPVDGTCHPYADAVGGFEDCRVVPDGDRSADGVVFDAAHGRGALHLRRLECTDDACAWTPIAAHELGAPGPWGGSTWESRLALRDADGRLFVVHDAGGYGERPVRVAGAGREHEIPGLVYGAGAAARPSGGLVVVTSYYSEALWLHLIDDDPDDPAALVRISTRIGSTPIDGTSLQLRVLVPPAADRASERAHLFLTASGSAVEHLTVDLETASVVARETIDL